MLPTPLEDMYMMPPEPELDPPPVAGLTGTLACGPGMGAWVEPPSWCMELLDPAA